LILIYFRLKNKKIKYSYVHSNFFVKVDLPQIKTEYERSFGKSLYDAVKSEISGDYEASFIAFLKVLCFQQFLIKTFVCIYLEALFDDNWKMKTTK